MLFKKTLLITTIYLGFGLFVMGQVCPNGMKWSSEYSTCIPVKETNVQYKIQNYKCPNGQSWVNFKNRCLDNSRVREIYDSLKVEYLKSPAVVSRAPVAIDAPSIPKSQRSSEPTPTIIYQNNSTPSKVYDDDIALLSQNVNQLQAQLEQLRNEVKTIKEVNKYVVVNQQNPANVGKSKDTYMNNIYGKEGKVEFEILCPNNYKWVEEESICLKQEAYNERIQAKMQNAGAIIKYEDKDVKCPRGFLWDNGARNCRPTVSAIKK